MDFDWGGFKGSPKFPQFYVFESFLHFYKKNKNVKYYDAVKILFKNVCSRGLYDHLLGGIARYSTEIDGLLHILKKCYMIIFYLLIF